MGGRGGRGGGGGSDENNFVSVVASNFDVLAGPLVALVYPLYASIKAIESGTRADDQQWLTYWVLYSLVTLFELTCSQIIECFPLWGYAKLFLTCWLVLPQFNGAAYVYKNFIRPFYMDPTQTTTALTMRYMPIRRKNLTFFKQDDDYDHMDILSAAEKYMRENGTDDFQRLIRKTDRETKSRRSPCMVYDDKKEYRPNYYYNKYS